MDLVGAATLAIGVIGLAIGWVSLRNQRSQPLSSLRRESAEKLRIALEELKDDIVDARGDDENALCDVSERWTHHLSQLRPHLDSQLVSRADSLATLLELGDRLKLYKDAAWITSSMRASSDVIAAATAHSHGTRAPMRIFPEPDETRELITRGQTLGTPLEELNKRLDAMLVAILRDANTQTRRQGLITGMMIGGGAALLAAGLIQSVD